MSYALFESTTVTPLLRREGVFFFPYLDLTHEQYTNTQTKQNYTKKCRFLYVLFHCSLCFSLQSYAFCNGNHDAQRNKNSITLFLLAVLSLSVDGQYHSV